MPNLKNTRWTEWKYTTACIESDSTSRIHGNTALHQSGPISLSEPLAGGFIWMIIWTSVLDGTICLQKRPLLHGNCIGHAMVKTYFINLVQMLGVKFYLNFLPVRLPSQTFYKLVFGLTPYCISGGNIPFQFCWSKNIIFNVCKELDVFRVNIK